MKTIKQIADEVGVSKQTVTKRLPQLPISEVVIADKGIRLISPDGERILKELLPTSKPQLPLSEPLTQKQLDKEAERFCVYKHTVPNGRVYIGITSMKPSRRWANGDGYKANDDFYKDIVEHGWDNIDHRIVLSGLLKNEAETEEDRLILEYRSYLPEYGYNRQFRLLPQTENDSLCVVVSVLQEQLRVKDEQIAKLTDTIKAQAQSINVDRYNKLAGTLQMQLTDNEIAKPKSRWQRLKSAWKGGV